MSQSTHAQELTLPQIQLNCLETHSRSSKYEWEEHYFCVLNTTGLQTTELLLNGQDPGVAGAICLIVIALDVAEFSSSLFCVGGGGGVMLDDERRDLLLFHSRYTT